MRSDVGVEGGRVALVTGGSQGIGAAIADVLLADGLRVAVLDVVPTPAGRTEELEARGHAARLLTLEADVSDPAAWEAATAEVAACWGTVDVLVNNAGISPKTDGRRISSHMVPLTEWHDVLAVNLTGAFLGCQLVLPGMIEQGWGRIVNISSQSARNGARIAGVHYGVSKTGLLGLTRTLAAEYASYGITTNAVALGRIETSMAHGATAATNDSFLATIPVNRFGTPDEAAGAVSYLASDGAGFVNGATIDVNGGAYMG